MSEKEDKLMNVSQPIGVTAEFGYYPQVIDIVNDRFSIQTLPNLQEIITAVKEDPNVYQGWIYSGAQQSINLNGQITTRPYNSRIFGMHKTHTLTLHKSHDSNDLDFIVWCLSFFTGMRLTTIEAGFLDATPIEPGKLVDFVLSRCSIEDVINLALDYLEKEQNNIRATKQVAAAIHSLFLSQYPQNLPFERFQYLYMASDSCYKLIKDKVNPKPKKKILHRERIPWMCEQFQMKVPDWADIIDDQSKISVVRNDAFHEALFFDEPLGFAIYDNTDGNVILQMRNLICRLLIAILGKPNSSYIKTDVQSRLRQGINLREM